LTNAAFGILPHIDGIGQDGTRRSGECAIHTFKDFFFVKQFSFGLTRWIFHIFREGGKKPIESMFVGTCAFPICLMIVDIKFGLFICFLCLE
jgi:hypothetical protein